MWAARRFFCDYFYHSVSQRARSASARTRRRERLRQEGVHAAAALRSRIARGGQKLRIRAVKRADHVPLCLREIIVLDRRQQAVGRGGHALVRDQIVFHDDRPVHAQRRQQQHRADADAVLARGAVVEQRPVRLCEQMGKKLPVGARSSSRA